jgi:hypothetical protein
MPMSSNQLAFWSVRRFAMNHNALDILLGRVDIALPLFLVGLVFWLWVT